MATQRIVIDLYDHTKADEVADILEALRGVGIDGARFERYVALGGGNPHTLDGWQAASAEVDSFTMKPTDQLTYDQLYAAWRGDRISDRAYRARLGQLGLTGDRLEDLTRSAADNGR